MTKAKNKLAYFCRECGNEFPKWQGQCSECGQWNTLIEAPAVKKNTRQNSGGYAGEQAKITKLTEVFDQDHTRIEPVWPNLITF